MSKGSVESTPKFQARIVHTSLSTHAWKAPEEMALMCGNESALATSILESLSVVTLRLILSICTCVCIDAFQFVCVHVRFDQSFVVHDACHT
jgi:hypothetical protein